MEKQYCSNAECPKHRIHMGGRFKYSVADGKTYCEDCFTVRNTLNDGKNLWDFTTTHFDGHPVHVRSGRHLDQLCRQHGVSNHARENYERHW